MISVIIPTYNAKNVIEKLLDSILSQTIKAEEIIIIDSSSTDNTVEIARNYTDKIHTIEKSEFRHGAVRTKGAKLAKSDLLLFFSLTDAALSLFFNQN